MTKPTDSSGKTREDHSKAWSQVVEKDRKIGNKYGDVLLSGK